MAFHDRVVVVIAKQSGEDRGAEASDSQGINAGKCDALKLENFDMFTPLVETFVMGFSAAAQKHGPCAGVGDGNFAKDISMC